MRGHLNNKVLQHLAALTVSHSHIVADRYLITIRHPRLQLCCHNNYTSKGYTYNSINNKVYLIYL